MFKDAFSVLPARPAMYIAPLIALLVLSFYYRDLFNKCADIRQYRVALNEQLRSMGTGGEFRLADFTDFVWDKVRIVVKIGADTKNVECPFDWNWTSGERDSLVAAGKLSAVVFGQQGRVVNYLELRSDEVLFRATDSHLTPETAVFSIEANSTDSGGVTLNLND